MHYRRSGTLRPRYSTDALINSYVLAMWDKLILWQGVIYVHPRLCQVSYRMKKTTGWQHDIERERREILKIEIEWAPTYTQVESSKAQPLGSTLDNHVRTLRSKPLKIHEYVHTFLCRNSLASITFGYAMDMYGGGGETFQIQYRSSRATGGIRQQ